ncbi:MAG: type IV pilus assembly protein PilM [Acidimicrobiia bacterium]|nr:type IV pilus assembly protein PilM [Acidimicrobiia bacterium]
MARRRAVGLDIGTNAVRAAEVSFGRGGPVLRRFGQVALPYGTVVAGEVVDVPAVSAALRRLWKEVGYSSRKVVVGVANSRVVARVSELPDMPDADIRSSLQYQVQDLIPIPLEEAVLDYQVLERTAGPDDSPLLRLLLVAAHRDMLRSLLAALEGAGLASERIDLIPFALIRALHDATALGLEDDRLATEAIVGVGAGVTNVVVHERGLPRFVRTLPNGGNALVEALAADLSMDLDSAEGLKRSLHSPLAGGQEDRAVAVVTSALDPLVADVVGTLEFYGNAAGTAPLERVILTGGGARLPELAPRIESSLGVDVVTADPLLGVTLGDTGFPEQVLRAEADLLTVALGLALGAEPLPGQTRRITLLPTEIGERRRERRQAGLVGAGVAGLAALLLGAFLLRDAQVGDAERAAESEEARTGALQQDLATLAQVEALATDLAARRDLAAATLAGDVSWTRLLQEVSTAMPNDVWLTSFTASRQQADAPAVASDTVVAPTVSVTARGLDQTSTARWLLRVAEIDSLDGLWVSSSTTGVDGLVEFTSDAELTEAARSGRVSRFAAEEQP